MNNIRLGKKSKLKLLMKKYGSPNIYWQQYEQIIITEAVMAIMEDIYYEDNPIKIKDIIRNGIK